jgi:hypothetical protein
MSELEIWKAVNKCETPQQLKDQIMKMVDGEGMIQGRTRKFSAEEMAMGLDMYMKNEMPANVVTREYGLRQQAIYLKTIEL